MAKRLSRERKRSHYGAVLVMQLPKICINVLWATRQTRRNGRRLASWLGHLVSCEEYYIIKLIYHAYFIF